MIVVSSVSCLYGLGDPIDYKSMVISLRVGQEYPLDSVLKKLTEIRYERNDLDFSRNKFRLRGDTLEIYPAYWSGTCHPGGVFRRRGGQDQRDQRRFRHCGAVC